MLRSSVSKKAIEAASDLIGERQINARDENQTFSEDMIPGSELLERIRWMLYRLGTGQSITLVVYVGTLTYRLSPIAHLHLVIWIPLLVVLAFLGLIHVNTIATAKTWSLFSGFLILLSASFSLVLLSGVMSHG